MVGDFDASTDPDCNSLFCSHKARHYGISHIIKYPSFESKSYKNNIALLRLSTSIEFTGSLIIVTFIFSYNFLFISNFYFPLIFLVTAQPICLPPAQLIVNEGKIGTLVGWGKLSLQRGKLKIKKIIKYFNL